MPCDSVAVVQARLEPTIGSEIVGNQAVLEALRGYLAQQHGAATITANSSRYVQIVVANRFLVYLHRNGDLTVSDQQSARSYQAEKLKKELEAILPGLAMEAAVLKLDSVLKRKYKAVEQPVAKRGYRMLTVEV